MYVCMHACMYACMHACVDMYMYVCAHTHTHIHTLTHTHKSTDSRGVQGTGLQGWISGMKLEPGGACSCPGAEGFRTEGTACGSAASDVGKRARRGDAPHTAGFSGVVRADAALAFPRDGRGGGVGVSNCSASKSNQSAWQCTARPSSRKACAAALASAVRAAALTGLSQ